jgi:hypothetical protein
MSTRLERRTVAKTAAYTVNPALDRPGTVFTNAGAAGAVTFTLPLATRALLGWWYRFLGVVDQNFTVASNPVDTLIVINDTAADSLTVSTAGQKIGAEIEAQCVETSAGVFRWVAKGNAVGHTYTVAT